MEQFSISQTPTGISIEGFPEAIKVIKIKGPKAQRLSDLALHKEDLVFAKNCLDAINDISNSSNNNIVQEALWRSAITHYIKCFGDQASRFSLDYKKVYSEILPRELHLQFKILRNKHFLHDENSYAQSISGAILNKPGGPYKIAKIINLNIFAKTLFNDSFSNLKLLIEDALAWVIIQYDSLCNDLTVEYEKVEHDTLMMHELLDYTLPFNDAISEPRKKLT